MPHVPQFCASLSGVHSMPQSRSRGGQVQAPARQSSPALGQAEKQPPHEKVSWAVSTHRAIEHSSPRPSQLQVPLMHGTPGPQNRHVMFPVGVHWPERHASFDEQACPQAPQCRGLLVRSTH